MSRFRVALLLLALGGAGTLAPAQGPAAVSTADAEITHIDLPIGRSFPIRAEAPLTHASVANPDIADVVVIDERNVVINGKSSGETDVLLWEEGGARIHYRVIVHALPDREQIVISIKFAEVRRDLLRQLGASGLYRDKHVRVGTGLFHTDDVFNPDGTISVPATTGFGTVLTDFGSSKLLAFLDAQEQKGNARTLAEPHVMAANREDASFLAGGELPIPVAQASATGVPLVTIIWREFGIRLFFNGDIIGDSLIRLKIRPEVSSLDFTNAITLSGFQIPALRTRRVESTIDMRRDQSLIISGLFDDEREKVKTGVPLLMSLPILGSLFSSTQWQRHETELLIVVTPVLIDPLHPRAEDVLQLRPDSTLPASEAMKKVLPSPPPPPAAKPPQH